MVVLGHCRSADDDDDEFGFVQFLAHFIVFLGSTLSGGRPDSVCPRLGLRAYRISVLEQ